MRYIIMVGIACCADTRCHCADDPRKHGRHGRYEQHAESHHHAARSSNGWPVRR